MQQKWAARGCPVMMAGPTRFELATSGVTGRRSNQLNYDPARNDTAPTKNNKRNTDQRVDRLGGRYRIRTCDSRCVKPVLYP